MTHSRKVLPATVAGTLLAAAAFLVLAICGGASSVQGKEKQVFSLDPAMNCLALGKSAKPEFFDAPHETMVLNAGYAEQFFARILDAAPGLKVPPGEINTVTFIREDGASVALGLFSFNGTTECGFATIPVRVLSKWATEVLGRQV